MIPTKDELKTVVGRYGDELGVSFSAEETVALVDFAGWLLSQNLQQCNVSGLLPPAELIWQQMQIDIDEGMADFDRQEALRNAQAMKDLSQFIIRGGNDR